MRPPIITIGGLLLGLASGACVQRTTAGPNQSTAAGSSEDSGGGYTPPKSPCAWPSGGCPSPDCSDGSCGGPLSGFDVDGCVRLRCPESHCPEGLTCVDVVDYGGCVPQHWICEPDEDQCMCDGDSECSMATALCIPDELVAELPPRTTPEEYFQMCSQAAPGACDEVPAVHNDDDVLMRCVERTWVPTTLGPGDVCEFGDVVHACAMFSQPQGGCEGETPTCEVGGAFPARTGEGAIEIGFGSVCDEYGIDTWCEFTAGELTAGPPECRCLCEGNFPG